MGRFGFLVSTVSATRRPYGPAPTLTGASRMAAAPPTMTTPLSDAL